MKRDAITDGALGNPFDVNVGNTTLRRASASRLGVADGRPPLPPSASARKLSIITTTMSGPPSLGGTLSSFGAAGFEGATDGVGSTHR